MDFQLRQKKLREHLATTRYDALLVSHLPNIRYLCGFTGSAGLLLVEGADRLFFTDVRYDTQAREEVKGAKVVIARQGLLDAVAEHITARRKGRRTWALAIEADHLTVSEKNRLGDPIPRSIRLRDARGLIERQRTVKDEEELESIRAAVKLGDRGGGGDGIRGAAGGGGSDVVSDDHCVRGEVGAAARAGYGANDQGRGIRGLRFRCYTRRLLLRPDAYCVGGRGFAAGAGGLRGGEGSTVGRDRCGAAWGEHRGSGWGGA
jgi:hypothetical protein